MLVKELRQGLRTRSFIGVFLALQIILAVILLSAGATATSDDAGSTISNIIFIFFSIAVLIIQPMRGITALSSEVKGNTIDMMVLTRLSAWRIVTGKWSAIVSQSALMLITIIPYLILRYFFGGMNLLGEIVLLALVFCTSAALTAVTVGLSASGSVILRSILPMLSLPLGAYVLMMMMMFGSGRNQLIELCSLETISAQVGIGLYLAACAYGGFFILSIGTSLIAPYAENHSTLRRLVALAVTLAAIVVCSMPTLVDPEALPFVFVLIFAPLFTISLSEFSTLVPPVYRRFTKYGHLGRIAAFFLSPGWASGVFFCMLLTVLAAIPFFFNASSYKQDEMIIVTLAFLSSLLFPALLIILFKSKGPIRVSNFILFFVASFVTSAVLMGVAESLSNRDFIWLFVWLPPILLFMSEQSRFDNDSVLISSVILTLALVIPLMLFALTNYKKSLEEIRKSES